MPISSVLELSDKNFKAVNRIILNEVKSFEINVKIETIKVEPTGKFRTE